jgi:hypothetical protein
MKDYYKADSTILANPFDFLYQQSDAGISQDDAIQELIDYATELEDQIEGDFNLGSLVFEIRNNTLSFVRTGLIAFKIKALKLYKNQFGSFRSFCTEALGVTHWQINRTIQAARTVLELIHNGFEILPRNEAQCRELSQYVGSELVRVWAEITSEIPAHKITANSIHEYLNPEEEIEEENTTVKLPRKLYSCIFSLAVDAGMSIVELLEDTFIGHVEPVPIGTLLRWEEDYQDLVSEHSIDT